MMSVSLLVFSHSLTNWRRADTIAVDRMGKVHHRRLKPGDRRKLEQELWHAIAAFCTVEEIKRFLDKLLTRSEKVMLGRRIQIAKMLLGDKSYEDIKRELGVGESTITSVYEWLDEEDETFRRKLGV